MRYPCAGFPACVRSFGNGHVLRAHQLSCQFAQKKLVHEHRREEHARQLEFDYRIRGMKANQYYPTCSGLDHREKFLSRDQYSGQYRPLRQPADPTRARIQTKSTAMDFSGYYT